MLPSNPRARPGLPGRPQARSPSAGPERHQALDFSAFPSHQPTPSAPRLRERPPLQPSPRQAGRSRGNLSTVNPRSRAGASPFRNSDDSTSSYASSILDPPTGRTGYASSRTSLEDNDQTYCKPSSQGRGRRDLKDNALYPSYAGEDEGNPAARETGAYLWNTVATMASNLTISVTKAWAITINMEDGEETPPGQDSRLTRAMKAYHVAKAKDPSDLPSWLFTDRERGLRSSTRAWNDEPEVERSSQDAPVVEPAKLSGLRTIYQTSASTVSQDPTRREPGRHGDDGPAPSRAADRLRAMRDAKRGLASRSTFDDPPPGPGRETADSSAGTTPVSGLNVRPARVGLPSRPTRGRR